MKNAHLNQNYNVPKIALTLGVTKQAVYQYIHRFQDDFLKAKCLHVQKIGLKKRYSVVNFNIFLTVLRDKGAEFPMATKTK